MAGLPGRTAAVVLRVTSTARPWTTRRRLGCWSGWRQADVQGVVHVAGRERLSRFELMAASPRRWASTRPSSGPTAMADVTLAEPRPADVSLDTSRLASLLPDVERPPVETAILE